MSPFKITAVLDDHFSRHRSCVSRNYSQACDTNYNFIGPNYKREVFQEEAVVVDRNSNGRMVVLSYVNLEGRMK